MCPQDIVKFVLVHVHYSGRRVEKVEFRQYAREVKGSFHVSAEDAVDYPAIVRRLQEAVFSSVNSRSVQFIVTDDRTYNILVTANPENIVDFGWLGCPVYSGRDALQRTHDWNYRRAGDCLGEFDPYENEDFFSVGY